MNNIKNPQELLKFMANNIKYGYVDKQSTPYFSFEEWNKKCVVQKGKEIVKTLVGTCWDQVEFERLWFSKHNFESSTYFIWFECEKNLPTHTFLVYKQNNKFFWFENAFENERGIHEYNSLQNLFQDVKQKHFNFCKDVSLDDFNCLKIYEYSELKHNMSVNEFINHATKNKKGVL